MHTVYAEDLMGVFLIVVILSNSSVPTALTSCPSALSILSNASDLMGVFFIVMSIFNAKVARLEQNADKVLENWSCWIRLIDRDRFRSCWLKLSHFCERQAMQLFITKRM